MQSSLSGVLLKSSLGGMAGKGVCLSSAPKRLRVFLDTQYILKILAMTYDLLYNLTIVDMIHPHNSMFQKKPIKFEKIC